MPILGKGNLDAALDDYDQVLKINPNYVRAYVSAAGSSSRNAATSSPHVPTIAQAASAWQARRVDMDTTLARAVAKEPLVEALLGSAAPTPAGKASPSTPQPAVSRKVMLIIGNGAGQECCLRWLLRRATPS